MTKPRKLHQLIGTINHCFGGQVAAKSQYQGQPFYCLEISTQSLFNPAKKETLYAFPNLPLSQNQPPIKNMEPTKSELKVRTKTELVKKKKPLTILPTNQLLQQVWDYILTRPNKKGESKKPAHECLFLLVKKELNLPVNVELAPHTLRRCFATYNAISGMPLPVLQKVLGHSKISTTALYIKDSDLIVLNPKRSICLNTATNPSECYSILRQFAT
ncbi:9726_t:CDS:2 [Entrophospora sp. SA101]|nr:9726_t:CDS:2 [Entrophospora sp. SA101]